MPHQCAHWFAMTTGERGCEFAQSIANLLAFPAGTRIAAPVCALVRNDMQKEGRVRGCKYVVCGGRQKAGVWVRLQGG